MSLVKLSCSTRFTDTWALSILFPCHNHMLIADIVPCSLLLMTDFYTIFFLLKRNCNKIAKNSKQTCSTCLLTAVFFFFSFFTVCQTSVDLAFILDTSGSVGSYNFQQVKNFVKDVVDFFNIGTSGTHVAVVTYSLYTRLEFNLKAHYTKSAIKNAVGNIYYRAGWMYTADALDFVRRNIFVTAQVSNCIYKSLLIGT